MICIQFVSSAGLKLTLFASILNGASTVNNVFPSNSSRVTLNLARLKQSTKYCLTSSFSHFSEKQTRYSPAAILPPRCHVFQCHVTSTHHLPTAKSRMGKWRVLDPEIPGACNSGVFTDQFIFSIIMDFFSRENESTVPLDTYRKIPKISPRAYSFQRPFLRGLFFEGLIFGGAYLRREISVYKSIGLA